MRNDTAKIIVIGAANVGKTTLICEFVRDEPSQIHNNRSTIGFDIARKSVAIDRGRQIDLEIWDTAGQEGYCLPSCVLREADAAIIMYDITSVDSFTRVEYWREQLARFSFNENLVTVLVGNKHDKEFARRVLSDDGRRYAERHAMTFLEITCRAKHSVNHVFMQAARKVVHAQREERNQTPTSRRNTLRQRKATRQEPACSTPSPPLRIRNIDGTPVFFGLVSNDTCSC